MNNVIQFRPRAKPATVVKETQWDKDFAEVGGTPAYELHCVMKAISVAYQTGNIRMGDKLLAACRAEGWDSPIPLGKELGNFLHAADFNIAIYGPQEHEVVR